MDTLKTSQHTLNQIIAYLGVTNALVAHPKITVAAANLDISVSGAEP